MKQKVINVKYRKSSDKFPNWMKYEVTLMSEDGTTETIPAYGKGPTRCSITSGS
jgi:hypothetical protein